MNINSIVIQNSASIYCRSVFYCANNSISDKKYIFTNGINRLYGDIDTGEWAVSYLMSMYQYQPKDFIFHGKQHVEMNNEITTYQQISDYSCYLDKMYPLFSSKKTIEDLVSKGLNKSDISLTANEIMNLFHLSQERFTRPINAVGNEIFQAMAAIGYSYGKEVFCFPWFSKKRYNYYRVHLETLLETLDSLCVMAIFPSDKL